MALSGTDYLHEIDSEAFAVLKTAQAEYADTGSHYSMLDVLGFLLYLPDDEGLVFVVNYLRLLAYRNYMRAVARVAKKAEQAENILGQGMGN